MEILSLSSLSTDNEDEAAVEYQRARAAHRDAVARRRTAHRTWGGAYHRRLVEVYRFLIPPGRRVLEIGCGEGDLLAASQSSDGIGVDFSAEMLRRASQRHPELHFVQAVFQQITRLSAPHTRLILNFYSRLWELPLKAAQGLGLATPLLPQNWLTVEDVRNLMNLAGFEAIRSRQEVLWPMPLLGAFFNRFLARGWLFHQLALAG